MKAKTGNLFEQPKKLTSHELRQRQSWVDRDNQITAEQEQYERFWPDDLELEENSMEAQHMQSITE